MSEKVEKDEDEPACSHFPHECEGHYADGTMTYHVPTRVVRPK